MDERYRAIYEAIYEARVRRPLLAAENQFELLGAPTDQRLRRIVSEAIAQSEQERRRRDGARLREDAKALLAVNFRDLVLLPLFAGGLVNTGGLQQDVAKDMTMLVSDANVDGSKGAPEISGHGIIDSLSKNWGSLRISRLNLWGGS